MMLVRGDADTGAGVDAREVALEPMPTLNFHATWQSYLKCVLELSLLCSPLFIFFYFILLAGHA